MNTRAKKPLHPSRVKLREVNDTEHSETIGEQNTAHPHPQQRQTTKRQEKNIFRLRSCFYLSLHLHHLRDGDTNRDDSVSCDGYSCAVDSHAGILADAPSSDCRQTLWPVWSARRNGFQLVTKRKDMFSPCREKSPKCFRGIDVHFYTKATVQFCPKFLLMSSFTHLQVGPCAKHLQVPDTSADDAFEGSSLT